MDNNHCNMILAHLKSGKAINPLEALDSYGCFRLGARIFDLRERGVEIDSQFITTATGKRVKEYWLNG